MSWFGSLKFFGGGPQKEDEIKESVLKLRGLEERFQKREKYLQTQIDEQQENAKKLLAAGNKNGAKMALRRKKAYESNLEDLSKQQITLMENLINLENAAINRETYSVYQQTSKSFTRLNKAVPADKVEQTMDDLREAHANNQEISVAMTSRLHEDPDLDDKLDEELAGIESELVADKMTDDEAATKKIEGQLASAPRAPIRSQKASQPVVNEDNEELERMRQEMELPA